MIVWKEAALCTCTSNPWYHYNPSRFPPPNWMDLGHKRPHPEDSKPRLRFVLHPVILSTCLVHFCGEKSGIFDGFVTHIWHLFSCLVCLLNDAKSSSECLRAFGRRFCEFLHWEPWRRSKVNQNSNTGLLIKHLPLYSFLSNDPSVLQGLALSPAPNKWVPTKAAQWPVNMVSTMHV